MTMITDVPKPAATGGVRPALVVAVCGSAMAGLVHAAAARGHDGNGLLVWMFVLCAIAQVGWAVAAMIRPSRAVLGAGAVISGGAVIVWALTRTVGIPFIDSLAEVESVGTQDLAAALFAAASLAGVVRMLAVPVVRATITPAWAGALAAVSLLAAMPALRADHSHAHGDHTHLEAGAHAHGDGEEHAHGSDDADHGHEEGTDGDHAHDEGTDDRHGHDEGTDGGHAHDGAVEGESASHGHTSTGGSASHDHPSGTGGSTHPHPPTGGGGGGHDHPTDPTDPTHPHPPSDPSDPDPSGPIISLDDPRVTAAQRAVAVSLIDDVETALAGATVASIQAAGYQWIGDGGAGGYQHFVNWTFYTDGIELDPSRIESIVVKDGQVVSGMYILNPGKTMADVPDLAGELTTWHDHQNLCFSGTQLVGIAVDGKCARGVLTPTPPMLHVWLVPHPCGPFAGIESHGGSACGTHEH